MNRLSNSEAREQAQSYAWLFIVKTMNAQQIGFKELVQRLAHLGVHETAAGASRRLNRKSFSAGFFLLCCQALEINTVNLGELRLTKRGLDRQRALEDIEAKKACGRRGPKGKGNQNTVHKAQAVDN